MQLEGKKERKKQGESEMGTSPIVVTTRRIAKDGTVHALLTLASLCQWLVAARRQAKSESCTVVRYGAVRYATWQQPKVSLELGR